METRNRERREIGRQRRKDKRDTKGIRKEGDNKNETRGNNCSVKEK